MPTTDETGLHGWHDIILSQNRPSRTRTIHCAFCQSESQFDLPTGRTAPGWFTLSQTHAPTSADDLDDLDAASNLTTLYYCTVGCIEAAIANKEIRD